MGLSTAAYAALGMQGLGSITSVLGGSQAGKAARAAGLAQQQQQDYEAQVLRQQAGQTRAQASAQAADTDLNTKYVLSDLRSRAAASGGGVTNPTVVNLASGIAGRGEYNTLAALYSGEERARGLENQAALDTYMGGQAALAGRLKQRAYGVQSVASVLQGGATMFSRYGAGGFNPPDDFGMNAGYSAAYPGFDFRQAG